MDWVPASSVADAHCTSLKIAAYCPLSTVAHAGIVIKHLPPAIPGKQRHTHGQSGHIGRRNHPFVLLVRSVPCAVGTDDDAFGHRAPFEKRLKPARPDNASVCHDAWPSVVWTEGRNSADVVRLRSLSPSGSALWVRAGVGDTECCGIQSEGESGGLCIIWKMRSAKYVCIQKESKAWA